MSYRQGFFYLCHVCDTSVGQFLKLCIVNVCTVYGNYVAIAVIGRFQHKAVIGSCRGELDVRRTPLVGMSVCVNLDSALLFPRFRMTPHALEYEV